MVGKKKRSKEITAQEFLDSLKPREGSHIVYTFGEDSRYLAVTKSKLTEEDGILFSAKGLKFLFDRPEVYGTFDICFYCVTPAEKKEILKRCGFRK